MGSLLRDAAAAGAAASWPRWPHGRRAAAAVPPRARAWPTCTCSACRCLAAARRRSSTRCLVLLGWRYVRRAERNERDFADLVDGERPVTAVNAAPGVVAVVAGHRRDPGDRHLGAAVLPHHQRLLRGLAHGAPGAERLGDRRRVPLRRLLPRRRRAACSTFGADMLWYPVGWTAGYLVLLVLVAAPLRRSGAYTLPDFAEARLGSRRGPRASARCWWWRSAGSTCCRSSRAPGSRCSAAIGAPRWLGARGRRGGRARQRAAPAGCAASRSCRPSSTGSS